MKRDSKWDVFLVPETFEDYCKESIPVIKLKNEVHQDVKNSFRIVQRLLELSYYEYEFFDQAAKESLLILEMALRIRHNELVGEFKNITLQKLIKWFEENKYLEVYNKYFMDRIRSVRNYNAHPKMYNFAGPLKRQYIEHAINVINGLWEDPDLRATRMEDTKRLNSIFQLHNDNGLKIEINGNTHFSHRAGVSFINNKTSPTVYTIFFRPIFYIPENYLDTKKLYGGTIHQIELTDLEEGIDEIIFHAKNQDFKISKLIDVEDKKTFDAWKSVYSCYDALTLDSAAITSDINRVFEKHLVAFHNQ